MLKNSDLLKKIYKLHPDYINLSLNRITSLLNKLNNPQYKLPKIIHIAGTNGKGSTLTYIKLILQNHGKKIHSYISPHIINFNERICLADKVCNNSNIFSSHPITENIFNNILEEVLFINNNNKITFFEIITVIALIAFSRINADYLLLEVGLGGRYDATNVINKVALSIITSISIDHIEYLGNKITEIAYQKAGIIKYNCPLIIGPQLTSVFNIIKNIAKNKKSKMLSYGIDFKSYESHNRLIYQDQNNLLNLPIPALIGDHQLQNASVAIAASKFLLGNKFKKKLIAEALKNIKLPARFQKINSSILNKLIPNNSDIWLDGGHNAAGGIAIANQLIKLNKINKMPLYLIVSMLKSKQAYSFLRSFITLKPKIFCVPIINKTDSFSAITLSKISINLGFKTTTACTIIDALKQIKINYKNLSSRIVICGSLYQSGNILRLIK